MDNSDIFKNVRPLVFHDVKACLVRSSFSERDIKKAVLNITGLGFFEAYVNGTLLSTDRLMPPKSDYEKRDLSKNRYPIYDCLTNRIYYYSYDITSLLTDGKNVIASHIGSGWYSQEECGIEGIKKWGDICLIFSLSLTLTDGTQRIITPSDTRNLWQKSYITRSNIYFGECIDGTKYQKNWMCVDFDDSNWITPDTRELPNTIFTLVDCPPDRVTGITNPTLIFTKENTKVYDLGSTLAGTPVVVFDKDAEKGDKADAYFADRLNDDFTPNFHYTGGNGRKQHDEFIYSPDFDEEYRLHFTWNAGRYVILEGNAQISCFEEVRTDIKQRVFIECDNPVLQWFFDAYVRTQEANIHGSVPSDCPHRERLGYTGDGQLCSAAVMYIFDARTMYRKWIRDIRDCQDKLNGHVQHTAPFYGGGGGPGGWGGAAVVVPWNYYRFYKNEEELAESFSSMKAYLRYMHNHSDNYLVTREEEKGWCLGDWCPPHNDIQIPVSFVNTFYFALCARLTAKTAEIIGKNNDIPELNRIFEGAVQALTDNFFDPDTGSFCGGVQGADAFAVYLGIGDKRTAENLVKKYSVLREFDTGIFGTYFLLNALFDIGENVLALDILTNKSENSFYNMMKNGSMNIWENWDACDSLCHPMFGACAELVVSRILGIDEDFFSDSE